MKQRNGIIYVYTEKPAMFVLYDVLGNKVQLGAGFSSSKEDFSDLEMNVTVSTKFFKDRLLLKASLGYQPQSADNGETSFC